MDAGTRTRTFRKPSTMFFWLFLLLTFSGSLQATKKPGGTRYKTAYACEGSEMSITCEEGHLIQLIRANYGRFSISICNEHGNLDWSVDCASHRSFYVINESCLMKRGCNLLASSSLFGDPCPGTLKYMEAHYQCVPDSTTTSTTTTTPATTTTTTSTPPPIIIPLTRVVSRTSVTSVPVTSQSSIYFSSTSESPPVTSLASTTSSTTPSTTSTTLATATKSQLPVQPEQSTTSEFAVTTPTKSGGQPSVHRVFVLLTTDRPGETDLHYGAHLSNVVGPVPDHCPPVFARQVQWNWTKAGEMAITKCPGGATGHAKWRCDTNPTVRWSSDSPDLSQCTSYWVDNLRQRVEDGDSVVIIASELAQLSLSKALHGGDVLQATDMLNRIVNKMADRVQDFTDENQRHKVVQELLESVLQVGSNVLDNSQETAWEDLPWASQRSVASALLESLERGSWLLARSQHNRYHFSRALRNVLVSVRLLEAWAVTEVVFPVPEDVNGTMWTRMEDSLILPAQAALGSSSDGVVKVVFMAFNKVQDFLSHKGQLDNSPYITKRASEVDSKPNVTYVVNSRVLAASVNGYHVVRLLEPVVITFRHIQEDNVSNPQCVYWDFNARSWSGNGCWVRSFNTTHTKCACNHLTNFALLMEVSASQVKDPMLMTLRLVASLGCAVAIFFLLLTAIVLLFCRGVKGDRAAIHKHLTMCLLLAESVFVGGIHQTAMPVVCAFLASVLHYLLVAVFIWLFLDCFNIYATVADLVDPDKSRLKWFYLLAYGVPAIVVGISAAVEPKGYGTPSHCWISLDNLYVFSFAGPALVSVLASCLFLGLTLCRACCQGAVVSKTQAKLKTAKCWCRRSALLFLLVTSCWTTALLYLYQESALMVYLFTAANALQGLTVFVALCLKNDKVKKNIARSLRRASWLPSCLQPSSKGSSGAASGASAADGGPGSLYIHSNGMVSLPANGPNSHSWSQPKWTSCQQFLPKPNITQTSATPGLQSTAASNQEAEECPLQNWLPNSAYNLARLEDTEPRLFAGMSAPYEEGPCATKGRTPSRHQVKDRNPYGKRTKRQEHIYESVDDDDVAPTPISANLRLQPSVPAYDPCSTWEQRRALYGPPPDAKILNSLSAVFSGSPRGRHLALLREGRFPYSGVPSSTDSERSSSSLMVDRSSSSPSVDSGSSPPYGPDSQLLQSMPNLQGTPELTTFSHVLKYPSANTVADSPAGHHKESA